MHGAEAGGRPLTIWKPSPDFFFPACSRDAMTHDRAGPLAKRSESQRTDGSERGRDRGLWVLWGLSANCPAWRNTAGARRQTDGMAVLGQEVPCWPLIFHPCHYSAHISGSLITLWVWPLGHMGLGRCSEVGQTLCWHCWQLLSKT